MMIEQLENVKKTTADPGLHKGPAINCATLFYFYKNVLFWG